MHQEDLENIPFFSIVMPIFNVKCYLEESIESVLKQTYGDFELILVDDGSTDGCGAVCEAYCEKDARCFVVHQENKGLLLARRTGISKAKGQYLINVDSDDKCKPEMLMELKQVIDIYSPDMVIYHYSKISDTGIISNVEPLFSDKIKKIERNELLYCFVSDARLNIMWIKCTRLQLVDRMVDYSTYGKLNMAEDELQTAALFENVEDVYYLNESLYLYRLNENSITKKQTPQMVIDSLKAKQRVVAMMNECKCDENLRRCFYRKYLRTLNGYILRNISNYKNKREYCQFIGEIKDYELKSIKGGSFANKIIYYILHSNWFTLIKVLGVIYTI